MQRCAGRPFAIVPADDRASMLRMSLNRSEQVIFDYLQRHAEERHFWQQKVRNAVGKAPDDHMAADQLQGELWRYFEERSAVAEPFREIVRREGLRRTSMRNLAEYLIRIWTPPRPKPRPAGAESKSA